MKFFKVLTTACLFIAAQATVQEFNLTALNGTWNLQGLPKSVVTQLKFMSRLYNISIDCPQVYITGNSTNTTFIQPLLDFKWYNVTSEETQSANITYNGLLTLQKGSNATDANFTAQFSFPQDNSQAVSFIKMLDTSFTGGDSENMLPQSIDYWANFTIKLASSENSSTHNETVYDAFFLNAYNFSSSFVYEDREGFERRDMHRDDGDWDDHDDGDWDDNDDSCQLLFTNASVLYDNSTFETVISEIGPLAANLTFLNNTCNNTVQDYNDTSEQYSIMD